MSAGRRMEATVEDEQSLVPGAMVGGVGLLQVL
jgi:hypothetical protein